MVWLMDLIILLFLQYDDHHFVYNVCVGGRIKEGTNNDLWLSHTVLSFPESQYRAPVPPPFPHPLNVVRCGGSDLCADINARREARS